MKQLFLFCLFTFISIQCFAGTIIYSYDLNDRVIGANYTVSTNQAMVSYEYDPAHNMTEHKVVTDRKYMRPFMIIISWMKGMLATEGT